MITPLLLLGLVVLLVAANAFFVAAEFALVTVDRTQVEKAASSGDRAAGSVAKALQTLSTQLSGCQLGITVTSLIVGFIAEPSIAQLLRPLLEASGLPSGSALAISLTLAFAIATVTQMVFGELVPKNWAIAEPLRVARLTATPHRWFTLLNRPLLALFNGSANAVVRLFGVEPKEELGSARSVQELSALATRSARQGTITAELAHHMTRSAELGTRYATDAMTPRARVEFLSADDAVGTILTTTRTTGFSRFPVIGEDSDDVVGMVHFKQALAIPLAERPGVTVADVMSEPVRVPASMPLDDVLEELRGGLQMALVVDEYGGTDGLITLEDLVEELVGEIDDEHDSEEFRHAEVDADRWHLSGMLRPDEVRQLIQIELPEGEVSETIGGLVIEQLGRFAGEDDEVILEGRHHGRLDDDGLPTHVWVRLRVVGLDGDRVDMVEASLTDPPGPS